MGTSWENLTIQLDLKVLIVLLVSNLDCALDSCLTDRA